MRLWKHLFIIPWGIISTSSYFWTSKWLNATNASMTLHTGDSVIALCLIIKALEQQAVPSMVRWMHVAQRGCSTASSWELMGTEPLRLEGTSGMPTGSHSRLPTSTLLQGWRLHNNIGAICSNIKSSSHWKKVFLHSESVFCVSLCAEMVKWMHKAHAKWRQVLL